MVVNPDLLFSTTLDYEYLNNAPLKELIHALPVHYECFDQFVCPKGLIAELAKTKGQEHRLMILLPHDPCAADNGDVIWNAVMSKNKANVEDLKIFNHEDMSVSFTDGDRVKFFNALESMDVEYWHNK